MYPLYFFFNDFVKRQSLSWLVVFMVLKYLVRKFISDYACYCKRTLLASGEIDQFQSDRNNQYTVNHTV